MGRGRVVIAGIAVVAAAALALVAVTRDDARSYGPSEVVDALRAQGLDMREATARTEGTALMPPDASFTVIVLESDRVAQDAYRQYEADTDPDTFEVRAGNVLVIADFSNSDTPLPSETRRRIRRALATLASR